MGLIVALVVIFIVVVLVGGRLMPDNPFFSKMNDALNLTPNKQMYDSEAERQDQKRRSNISNAIALTLGFTVVGFLIGGFIGFLLRPSAPFIGQLPFETVFKQGRNLEGLDRVLISTAETSFNYVVVGAIIGAIGGIITGVLLNKGIFVPVVTDAPSGSRPELPHIVMIPKKVELNQTPEQVVNILGQPEKMVNLGAKVIYVYKDMKIVFMNNKVSDVQ
jgi:hypothetical protein